MPTSVVRATTLKLVTCFKAFLGTQCSSSMSSLATDLSCTHEETKAASEVESKPCGIEHGDLLHYRLAQGACSPCTASRMHNASHACMSHWHAFTEIFRLASALKTHIDANTTAQTVWTIMQGLSITLQLAIVALLSVPVGPITSKLWHYTIAPKGSLKLHSACMTDLDGYDAVRAPCNKPWA